jgi:hypothetical protein
VHESILSFIQLISIEHLVPLHVSHSTDHLFRPRSQTAHLPTVCHGQITYLLWTCFYSNLMS